MNFIINAVTVGTMVVWVFLAGVGLDKLADKIADWIDHG
jgi:hypothetical protein